jgi:hypothetical protein
MVLFYVIYLIYSLFFALIILLLAKPPFFMRVGLVMLLVELLFFIGLAVLALWVLSFVFERKRKVKY